MLVEEGSSSDTPGRMVGLAVFLIGIGLLVMVFIWANQSLVAPAGSEKMTIDWSRMGVKLAWDLGRIFLLGYLAAAIAGRGAQLYGAASRASVRRAPPE